jgi:hypothetical protein
MIPPPGCQVVTTQEKSLAPLNPDGLLPEGLHDLTLDAIGDLFGRTGGNDRRFRLFEQLRSYVNEVKSVEGVEYLIVDGSFVTSKEEPGDIDMILVLRSGRALNANWRPADYNLISRRRVRRRYEFDLLVARADGDELSNYVELFSQVRGVPDARKGSVRLRL